MHYILYLRLPGFYARSFSGEGMGPIVIYRDKRVLDANGAAMAKQIFRGMPLVEAKSILDRAQWVPWREDDYREAQVAWLDQCAIFSDSIQPEEQHTAWVDLSGHPDPKSLAIRLSETLPVAEVGAGPSRWMARLASEVGIGLDGARGAFLSEVPTRLLSPIDPRHRERLEFLGYRTVGEVARAPLAAMRDQFGEASTMILACARGGWADPVTPLYPRDSVSARIQFEGEVDDLQTLDRGLQELARLLAERLVPNDLQSKRLILDLDYEVGTTRLARNFTKPISGYATALSALRLMVSSPPRNPVVRLRARLENATKIKRIQRELTGRTGEEERSRSIEAAFQHVRSVFGDASVKAGGEIEIARRARVLKAWKDATGWN